jgi:predicted peroxiredoxin
VNTQLLLIDSGVLLAKTEQNEGNTGFTNLGEVLKDCLEKGMEVCADKTSMEEQHLKASDIIDGVSVVGGKEIAEKIRDAKSVMIF